MSFLPQLNNTNTMQSVQQEFRGLNHNVFLDETELYDMKNMSVDAYPYASPRKKRGTFKDNNGNTFGGFAYPSGKNVHCNGIASKQGFCFAEGNRFYYKSKDDNVYHDIGEVTDGEKQFVSLGAYILIFPDKKYFWSLMYQYYEDTEENNKWLASHGLERTDYFGNLEATVQFEQIKMNMCNVYGEDYTFDYVQADMPDEDNGDTVENGTMWLDTSSSPAKMMEYSSSYNGWLEILSNYIKVTVEGDITKKFNAYDGVTLEGFPEILKDFNSATVMYNVEKTEDGFYSYFVIPGILTPQTVADEDEHITFNSADNSITYTANLSDNAEVITVKRTIPDMDFVCELDNRIWGCSNENHEIYSSKLGDPFNFNCFIGLSTDSYVLTIGSDGDFTGCISHLGYVLFFKEDCVHKLYGTKPTNYQITTVSIRGVQRGCERSMCIVNETLFYKSKNGVMMFQGSLPECISDELGTECYTDAVAGSCGNKYYISMKDSTGVWVLFVYDTATGLWHKEDNTHFKFTLNTSTELYYIDGDDFSLNTILGSGDAFSVERLVSSTLDDNAQYETAEYHLEQEADFLWSMESGDLYSGSVDNKYINRLRILMELKKDTKINIYLKYDNEKQWHCVCTKSFKYSGSTRNTYNIPIVPRRSRRMKMKITGIGDCLIQAIAKNIEQGSEL